MTLPGADPGDDVRQVSKLRLCFISNPNLVHTRRWVNWFAGRGHTVCLLADVPLKEAWNLESWNQVQVIDLSKLFYARYIRFPVWTLWLRNFLHHWQPDVLHAHRINSAGWLAAASGFHPYVVTPWGTDIFVQPEDSRFARFLAHYVLRHADLVTTLSHAMGEAAVKLGARVETLRGIQFGVELDIFKPFPPTSLGSQEFRRSLSLPVNARLVLSPRAVTPIYNLDVILQAIPLVKERFSEAVFIFVEYNTDRAYKKRLDELAAQLGLEGWIRWIPATRSRAEMAELYRLCEVVVSVPSTDGTPVSVLEAMASGKPVVCTDLAPLREFITHAENGLLVPVRQVGPLAEAIIQLLEHPGQAGEFGSRAHQVVVSVANAEVEMQRMEGLYHQLAGSRKSMDRSLSR
ncbi:MAG: hypothetical protein A2136_01485 [Chloroflexi bacterium RBG_16_54_11]|nr:MAG: hypothetical protein A2136_01485 [Chloroflexi bacterium RBG_16_54_11]